MYILVRDPELLSSVKDELQPQKPLFVDTETCVEYGKTDGGLYGNVRLIQIYQGGWHAAFILDCFFLGLEPVLNLIKDFHHVYHNASYDLHTINCHTDSTWLPRIVDDTFYLSKSVFSDKDKFDFYSCLDYAGVSDKNIAGIDKKENQKAEWGKNLTKTMLKYAAMDVLYLYLLYEQVKQGDDEAYRLDIANLRYAVHYDRRGIPMNRKAINDLRCKYLTELEKYKALIPCNINSPKQCKEWLGSDGTDREVLGIMSLNGNTDAENLIQARKHDKGLMFINKYDGERIKGFHNSCGARTSRMTCNGGDRFFYENNQNPPRQIFPCIEAPEGKTIVYKDYSGLELRVTVAYVGEPTMAKLMIEGKDLHTYTGCEIFGETPETLTKGQRLITKFFNFGLAYGAGAPTLQGLLQARGQIQISLAEVRELKRKWLEYYHYFKEWHDMHRKHFQVYGYIDTITGLGRTIRATRLTDSYNFPIQGTAAEAVKLGVHYLHTRYGEDPEIINVVHDSVAMLHPLEDADKWIERLNECMIDSWYYVIKDLAIPDLPMPAEAQHNNVWVFE